MYFTVSEACCCGGCARAGNARTNVLAVCTILQVFDEAKSRDSDHRTEERYDSSRHGSR